MEAPRRPEFIMEEVWREVFLARDWTLEANYYWKMIHYSIHYTVCTIISNFHILESGENRYNVLELRDRITAGKFLPSEIFEKIGDRMPDIYDKKTRKVFDVKIVKTLDETTYDKKKSEVAEITELLIFTLEGSVELSVFDFLEMEQIAAVLEFLTGVWDILQQEQTIETYYELISLDFELIVPVKDFWITNKILENSDMPLCPNYAKENKEKPKVDGDNWSKLEHLPILPLPDKGAEADWTATLIGSEGAYFVTEEGPNSLSVEVVFGGSTNWKIIREGNLRKNCLLCFQSSLEAYRKGRDTRFKIFEDIEAFGIGIKKKKKNQLFYRKQNAMFTEEWVESDFTPETVIYPSWIDSEIEDLKKETKIEWLELLDLPSYNQLDRDCEDITNSFVGHLKNKDIMGQIEKWVTFSSSCEVKIAEDREKITFLPIVTHKKILGVNSNQLWGICLLGPHHIKSETTRLPLLTLEFVEKDYPKKYRRWSFGSFEVDDGFGKIKQYHFLARVNSIARFKLFYLSSLRKVLAQPLSIYSKLILKTASETNEINLVNLPKIMIYKNGFKVNISLKKWAVEALIIEFLMAIYNNSQMEGFMANIRRLHMAREAFMSGHHVYVRKKARIEDKVVECIINNPIVFYLAKSWNELPILTSNF